MFSPNCVAPTPRPPLVASTCSACPGPLARLLSSFLESLNGDRSSFGLKGMEWNVQKKMRFFNYDLIAIYEVFFEVKNCVDES